MPAATEGMITGCRPSLRCSRTTAVRDKDAVRCGCANDCFGDILSWFRRQRLD